MPQSLEFRNKIVEWVGGREGVLAQARYMLATAAPLTRAGDASRIEPASARRHVVGVVLQAAKALSEPGLAAHVDAHVVTALDEYELMEGDRLTGADRDALSSRRSTARCSRRSTPPVSRRASSCRERASAA